MITTRQNTREHRSGPSRSGTLWHSLLPFAAVIFLLTQTIASHPQKPVRRFPIFNDVGPISSPGIAQLDRAIATGLETTPYLIELYNENIESTLFSDDAVQRRIRDWYREKYSDRKPDVIITDPPRAGMHEGLVNKILEIAAPTVVYVSCNPATQARDLRLLDAKYAVTRVQPVDMFPHTHHIENVVQLKLREQSQ